jgi:hypothetical protein
MAEQQLAVCVMVLDASLLKHRSIDWLEFETRASTR